jgi:hypothetical protein
MAAAAFGMDELRLDDEEAEKLGTSTERVLALYHTEVNPSVVAWMGLVFAIAVVYGPRIYAIRARLKREREAAGQPAAPDNLVTMQPAPARAQPAPAPPPRPRPEPPGGPVGTPTDLFGVGYSAGLQDAL